MIRYKLHSAYDWLGTEPLDCDATSFEALHDGFALQKKAMDLIGGGKDESCLNPLHDGCAALLLALTALDESVCSRSYAGAGCDLRKEASRQGLHENQKCCRRIREEYRRGSFINASI